MIKAKNKKAFAIKCISFASIIFILIICSLISNIVFHDEILSKYLVDGVYVYYSGEPVLFPLNIFLYLTTLNSLFIAIIMLLLGISILTNNEKLQKKIMHNSIWSYIVMIYIFMFITVLLFDCLTKFEAYISTINNFGVSFTSITIIANRFMLHHGLCVWFIFLFRNIYPEKCNIKNYFPYGLVAIIFSLWYMLITFIGQVAFQPYEWYPYIILHPEGFCKLTGITYQPFIRVIFAVILVIIMIGIIVIYYFIKRYLQRRSNLVFKRQD